MRRPNVLVIVADDMGYGDFGLFNDGRSSTPAIDALAAAGVCLTQHYSGAPVCAPARASLLTGRYAHRTGAVDTLHGRGLDRIALDELTLADLFRADGYRTGLVGKWHNGALDPRYHPNARGFEEFVGFSGGSSDYWDYHLDRNGTLSPGDGRYLTDVLTENAESFLRRHRRDPFLLVVAYNAPHFPLQAPQPLVDRYLAQGETLGTAITYAMVEAMDTGIARLDTVLHELGLADDTIVVFTSDNGPYLGDVHGVSVDRFNYGWRGAKHDVFEGGIRVPAVVRWPDRLEGGKLVHELVHSTEWLATLCAATGIPIPPELRLDGGDVAAVLAGKRGTLDPVRFWQNNRYAPRIEGNAAMRDGDWKLVRLRLEQTMVVTDADRLIDRALNQHTPDRITEVDDSPLPEFDVGEPGPPLLFNLGNDPFEQNDLAAQQPERVARMSAALERWFEDVQADAARSGRSHG